MTLFIYVALRYLGYGIHLAAEGRDAAQRTAAQLLFKGGNISGCRVSSRPSFLDAHFLIITSRIPHRKQVFGIIPYCYPPYINKTGMLSTYCCAAVICHTCGRLPVLPYIILPKTFLWYFFTACNRQSTRPDMACNAE